MPLQQPVRQPVRRRSRKKKVRDLGLIGGGMVLAGLAPSLLAGRYFLKALRSGTSFKDTENIITAAKNLYPRARPVQVVGRDVDDVTVNMFGKDWPDVTLNRMYRQQHGMPFYYRQKGKTYAQFGYRKQTKYEPGGSENSPGGIAHEMGHAANNPKLQTRTGRLTQTHPTHLSLIHI